MCKIKNTVILFSVLLVAACSHAQNERLSDHVDNLESPQNFTVCHGYGCKNYEKTGLTDEEWQIVRNVFKVPATSAAEEREMIAKAIAVIEHYVGIKTGTDIDQAGAQIINFNTKGQMDCIDEAFNSSSYLYLMRQEGLIKKHTLGKPYRRGYKIGRWAHSTATIHEIELEPVIGGDGHYVVDSWFHVNGALPEIVPASLWIKGWSAQIKRERYNFSAS